MHDLSAAHGPEVVEVEAAEPRAEWEGYIEGGMADLIGSFHLCLTLDAARKTGMISRLRSAPEGLSESQLISGLDTHTAGHLVRYLTIREMIETGPNGSTVKLTDKGRALTSDTALAQLGFYIEAYAPVLTRMDQLMTGDAVYGNDVQRNGAALGEHCATLFTTYHTPIILKILKDSRVNSILDLGCGGGAMLIDACLRNPDLRGVGLDIDAGAIDVAREAAKRAGVDDRLKWAVADAFRPETWPDYSHEAEAICAVGAVHEHFRDGEQAVIDILNTYADLLDRKASLFILGEPEIWYDDAHNDADLYLIHIFTAQGFPRRRNLWTPLFEKTELECRRVLTRDGIGPRFNFFELNLRSRG